MDWDWNGRTWRIFIMRYAGEGGIHGTVATVINVTLNLLLLSPYDWILKLHASPCFQAWFTELEMCKVKFQIHSHCGNNCRGHSTVLSHGLQIYTMYTSSKPWFVQRFDSDWVDILWPTAVAVTWDVASERHYILFNQLLFLQYDGGNDWAMLFILPDNFSTILFSDR